MRTSLGIILLAALVLSLDSRAVAADQPAGGKPEGGPCVDVQVGNERVPDFDCINRQLRLQADHAHMAPPAVAPVDTHSSSAAVGTANQSAAQQMMGNQFGKSALPQRPAPAFGPALPHAGAH
jgi:hypothetical protein